MRQIASEKSWKISVWLELVYPHFSFNFATVDKDSCHELFWPLDNDTCFKLFWSLIFKLFSNFWYYKEAHILSYPMSKVTAETCSFCSFLPFLSNLDPSSLHFWPKISTLAQCSYMFDKFSLPKNPLSYGYLVFHSLSTPCVITFYYMYFK